MSTRLLPLTGAYNFRDLGGYRTVDGRSTRWGVLFRSDTLHELTTDDLAVLAGLGLATVIDLRTAKEVGRLGRGPLAETAVHYLHASVLNSDGGEDRAAPTLGATDVSARYLWYLDNGSPALADALTLLGDAARYPAVFHCQAGKDRTGVLAALVLGLLGVERRAIVEDYVLTAGRMELIIGRLRRDPVYGKRLDELPASAFTVAARSIEGFLDGVDERYGGPAAWARQAGVDDEHLAVLRATLLA